MLQLYVLIQDTRVCSSVGASGTNLRDCILNTESESTYKYEVLCSDTQLNKTNSIDAIPTLFLQLSIHSKQTSVSFPAAKAPLKLAAGKDTEVCFEWFETCRNNVGIASILFVLF